MTVSVPLNLRFGHNYIIAPFKSYLPNNLMMSSFSIDAHIGLESSQITAPETVGEVQICAIVFTPSIACPIQFPFNISLVTENGTAGWWYCLKIQLSPF